MNRSRSVAFLRSKRGKLGLRHFRDRGAMNTNRTDNNKGSVLVIALMTMTILTMICATSLYIGSQNTSTGMQTAAWQQALTGAEAGVDAAVRALNENGTSGANAWTNWISVSQTGTTLPTSQPSPSPSPAASAAPDSSHYNYLPSSQLSINFPNTEGVPKVSAWVTIDTAGMSSSQDTNGQQWYRIRSTGQTVFQNNAAMNRVSNNRLDNDLRNSIALQFSRKGGNYLGPTRTIEVIVQPLVSGLFGRGILMKDKIQMSGSSYVDSFDSSNSFKSTNGLYDQSKRQSHGDIATLNSDGSDLQHMYVYGNLSYSGTAVQNTNNVQGTISTPFSATFPTTSDPSWAAGSYSTMNLNNTQTVTVSGTKGSPTLIKVSGDINLSSSNKVTIQPPYAVGSANYAGPYYVNIWVTGQFQTSSSAGIELKNGVYATFYVDNQIQMSGSSFTNDTGLAAALTLIQVGGSQVQISASANIIAVIDAPNSNIQMSGSGGTLSGAVIGNTLQMSASAAIHYDESLGKGTSSPTIGNYAYARWFEDNSDPTRNARDVTNAVHSIVY